MFLFFFFQAEDGIRDVERSRGLGDVYKRQAEYGYRTRELRLDSLMVSPPTLQRHELGINIHATFLYPT